MNKNLDSNAELKCKYGSTSWSIISITILFSMSGIALFFNKATFNDRGLIINNIIELSIQGATIFYWILFCFCILFLIAGFLMIVFKLTKNTYLLMNNNKITIPPIGFKKHSTEIYYTDIIAVNELKINNNLFLEIKTSTNKKKSIIRNLFSDKLDYIKVKEFIYKNMNH